MTRSVLLLCLAASVAHADSGMLPNGASLMFNRLFLHEHNSIEPVLPEKDPDSLWHYFNMAHCVCGQPGASVNPDYNEFNFAYEITGNAGSPAVHRPAEVWVGTSCDGDPAVRNVMCHRIDSAGIGDVATIANMGFLRPEVPVFDLLNPEVPNTGCQERVLSANVWVLMDAMATGMFDFFLSKSINTDTQPPPQPTVFHATGGEGAVQLSWDAPVGDVADIAFYQALCATEFDNPVDTGQHFDAKYITPFQLCGTPFFQNFKQVDVAAARIAPFAADGGLDAPPDAPPDAPDQQDVDASTDTAGIPTGFSQTDPAFICGEVDDATATSMRITGLKNGQRYKIALLTIDKFGNTAGTFFTTLMEPKAVTDFWEDLHGQGSQVEGGFCLIAQTYGDDNPLTNALRRFRDNTLADTALGRWLTRAYYATLGKLGAVVHAWWPLRILSGIALLPLVAFALLWHVLTLPGLVALLVLACVARRRSKLRRALAPATAALLWLAPGHARAQTPYWDDQTGQEPASLADEPGSVHWHAGIRVGPYTPGIDAQLGKSPGPYAKMFGTSSAWVPMLDVDHVLWTGVGQLLVGGSGGYMSRTAHAWAICDDPADFACSPDNPDRMRAGDKTSFKLIPLAATVTYRFTYLDDEFGVPVVPYAKVGLDYYIWWSTDPNGDFSNVNGNKARGASLGFEGSVGLAVRAERIDGAAAQSMSDSGLYHAGFYAELNAAKVDGFGSSKKLSVGANTWFAGVDFEF